MTKVKIETGICEASQEGSFMNATLQYAGSDIVFSIATELRIPSAIVAQGELAVAEYIRKTLTKAATATEEEGLEFEVQIGPEGDEDDDEDDDPE